MYIMYSTFIIYTPCISIRRREMVAPSDRGYFRPGRGYFRRSRGDSHSRHCAVGVDLWQMSGVRIAFPGSFSANRFWLPMSARFLTRVDYHSYSLLSRLPVRLRSSSVVRRYRKGCQRLAPGGC